MNNRISIDVNLGEYGCLSSAIASNKKHLIQELSIHGKVRGEGDREFLKSMCNSIDKSGNRTGGQLEVLDLSDANVYYYSTANERSIHYEMFNDCITLKKIIFGETYHIDARAFKGCVSLEHIDYTHYRHYESIDGVLYRIGKWRIYGNEYEDFGYSQLILIKYPAAKKEVKQIVFERVVEIEDYAFEDFKGTDLYLPGIPPRCRIHAFYKVDISRITLHVSKEHFNSYWSHPVWGKFQIVTD